METQSTIGMLAIYTLGIVVIVGLTYYFRFRQSPRNRAHIDNIAQDGPSATRRVRESSHPDDHTAKPLKQRLAESELSKHPDDPEKFGRQQAAKHHRNDEPSPAASRRL